MALKNVKVVAVDVPTETDQHPRYVLHYVGSDKTTWKIGNLAFKLDEESRTLLRQAKKDDTISAEITKINKNGDVVHKEDEDQSGYWTLMKVGAPIQATASSDKKPYKKSTSYDNTPKAGSLTDVEKGEGQQRGNALTNAVNIVIAKGVKDYKLALKDIAEIYNELLAIPTATTTTTTKTTAPTDTIAQPVTPSNQQYEEDFNQQVGF